MQINLAIEISRVNEGGIGAGEEQKVPTGIGWDGREIE